MKSSKSLKILVILMILLQIFIGQVYADDKEKETKETNKTKETVNQTTNETTNESSNQMIYIESNDDAVEVKAKIIEAGEKYEKEENGVKKYYQDLTFRILTGDRKEEKLETTNELTYDTISKEIEKEYKEGDIVYIKITEKDGEVSDIEVGDVVRQYYILGLIIFFLISLIVICGKKAIKPIVGIAIIIASVYLIFALNTFKGYNAILLSIATAIVIMGLIFIINIGLNKKSLSASIGTLCGVLIAGGITILFWYLARLTGDMSMAFLSLTKQSEKLNFMHLLFSGTIIATLGACMNIATIISIKLGEIKSDNPTIGLKELFIKGINIGKNKIGPIINTLILVYLGTSVSLILLCMIENTNFIHIINEAVLSSVIISFIASCVGIVYTIPITSIIFAFIHKDKTIYKVKSDNIVEGKRTLKI